MQLITHVTLVLVIVTGSFCQQILFTNPRVVTPCDIGARANIDRYSFTATVKGNISQLLVDNWSPFILLMALRPDSNLLDTLCMVDMSKSSCSGSPTDCITCVNSETEVKIQVSLLLRASHKGRTLRMEWYQRPTTTVYSDKNYTLPHIAEVNSVALTLSIDGETQLSNTKQCQLMASVHTENVYKLCCSSSVKPCFSQISFRRSVVATDGSPCATYTPVENNTGIIKLYYSLCSKLNYTKGDVCYVHREGMTTTPVPETTDEDSLQTSTDGETTHNDSWITLRPWSPKKKKSIFGLFFLVVLFMVGVVLAAALAVICLLRKKKTKRSESSDAAAASPSQIQEAGEGVTRNSITLVKEREPSDQSIQETEIA